jgi:phage-related protein
MLLEQSNRRIKMSINFEEEVLSKLSSIEDRLSSIEEKFEEATNFADGILSDENSILGMDGLNSIKDALTAFMPSQMEKSPTKSAESDPDSLQDLVGSLKNFRDRLSGIKSAIANLPDETSNTSPDKTSNTSDDETSNTSDEDDDEIF